MSGDVIGCPCGLQPAEFDLCSACERRSPTLADVRSASRPAVRSPWGNVGHGHVRPRPDGAKARCGGPALCDVCNREAARWDIKAPSIVPAQAPPTRRLIAFTGLAGAGKSTAAAHLVAKHGFVRTRFAGPLKAMLRALGLTEAEVDGDRKEVPCDLLGGRTPRYAMQMLGSEFGRQLIDPDLWTRAWKASLPAAGGAVVDDCRFPNEAGLIRELGGLIVRVERPGAGTSLGGHESETHQLPADFVVENTGSVDDLCAKVDRLAG